MDDVPLFQKVGARTLTQRISCQIRDAILSGALPEGQRLLARNLAGQLGTSLTVVREALIELEAEGFLTKSPNSATRVVKLEWNEVEELFAVREVLEEFAVREACRKATPEQVRLIEQRYEELLAAGMAEDRQRFNEHDLAFHYAIWNAAGNSVLLKSLERVVLPYFAVASIRIARNAGTNLEEEAVSHLGIVEGIRQRNPEMAGRALHEGMARWRQSSREELAG